MLRRFVAVLCCFLAVSFLAWGQAPEFSAQRVPVVGAPWAEADQDAFSFVILGDKTSGGEGKWPIFDKAVDSINLLAPEFVITVGDQIPGHMEDRAKWDAEWAEYHEHARRLQVPLIMIPGNHDISNTACYEFWKQDFGATYFSFVHRGCLFLVLNTEEERFDGRGPVWEKMMKFAEKALAENGTARHTFLFFHKPMWADPRFLGDWARLEKALGSRPYTAVAGHEHYLSAERRGGNLLVVQNATGGGIGLSEVKQFGCFHAFTHVKVSDKGNQYAVVEPEGTLWPVDVAPAEFRRLVNTRVVSFDAALPKMVAGKVHTEGCATVANPFDSEISVRLEVGPVDLSGWKLVGGETNWVLNQDAYSTELTLEPGKSAVVPLRFEVAEEKVGTPPAVNHSIRYQGNWLNAETMRMEQADVAPLYPSAAWRAVPRWQIAGPFYIGSVDQAGLSKRFGPEAGYKAGKTYKNGIGWRLAESGPAGLLNHNGIFGTADLSAAYNACSVFSPEARMTHALAYADNFSQVYVNGRLVESAQQINAPGGYVYVPIALKKGWNDLVVKVVNNRGDWFLRFLLADPTGDLKFSETR